MPSGEQSLLPRNGTVAVLRADRLGSTQHRIAFAARAAGAPCEDLIAYCFRCIACGELFPLHAEAYHGSGGFWEPEAPGSIRASLYNEAILNAT